MMDCLMRASAPLRSSPRQAMRAALPPATSLKNSAPQMISHRLRNVRSCALARTEPQHLAMGGLALASAAALFYVSVQSWSSRPGPSKAGSSAHTEVYVDDSLADWDRRFLKRHGPRRNASHGSQSRASPR